MTAGVMLVCSMFYTRAEVNERIGWTFQCNGLAVIIADTAGLRKTDDLVERIGVERASER